MIRKPETNREDLNEDISNVFTSIVLYIYDYVRIFCFHANIDESTWVSHEPTRSLELYLISYKSHIIQLTNKIERFRT